MKKRINLTGVGAKIILVKKGDKIILKKFLPVLVFVFFSLLKIISGDIHNIMYVNT